MPLRGSQVLPTRSRCSSFRACCTHYIAHNRGTWRKLMASDSGTDWCVRGVCSKFDCMLPPLRSEYGRLWASFRPRALGPTPTPGYGRRSPWTCFGQARLLRVLEASDFYRVEERLNTDAKTMADTNRDSSHSTTKRVPKGCSQTQRDWFRADRWPGNGRTLKSCVEGSPLLANQAIEFYALISAAGLEYSADGCLSFRVGLVPGTWKDKPYMRRSNTARTVCASVPRSSGQALRRCAPGYGVYGTGLQRPAGCPARQHVCEEVGLHVVRPVKPENSSQGMCFALT